MAKVMTTSGQHRLIQKIIARDGGKQCFYCGNITSKKARKYLSGIKVSYDDEKAKHALTLDHIVPRCLGGATDLDNSVIACYSCNQRKNNMSAEEYLKIIIESS